MTSREKSMRKFLAINHLPAKVKLLHESNGFNFWKIYNDRCVWNDVAAEILNNLGLTDLNGHKFDINSSGERLQIYARGKA